MPTNVLVFPLKHTYYKCDCHESSCMYCGGGLGYCTVCCGGEGSLTEHCCGRQLTEDEHDKIAEGVLDFRAKHGGWTDWTRDREMAVRRMVT